MRILGANMSDNFLREVRDDLRQEHLKKIWKKYGLFIVSAPVLIVAIVAGGEMYDYWRIQKAGEQGDVFEAAVTKTQSETGAGIEELKAIIEDDSSGYHNLARFRLAGQLAAMGQLAEAIAEYDAVIAGKARQPMKDVANIRAALLLVDAGDVSSVTARVGDMAVPSHPFRHIAWEILGLVHLANGQRDEAMKFISDALQDQQMSATTRTRLSSYQAQLVSEGIMDPNDVVVDTQTAPSAHNIAN